jgi:hypothetical protein
MSLHIGDKVRPTAEALQKLYHRHPLPKVGIVLARGKRSDGCWIVKWDNRSMIDTLSEQFLVKDPDPTPWPSAMALTR